jgi:hypothetical protein
MAHGAVDDEGEPLAPDGGVAEMAFEERIESGQVK